MSDKPLLVRGIKIDATPDILDDFEFVEIIAGTLSDDDNEKVRATVRMCQFVFGDKWPEVKAALRKQNDGKLPTEVIIDFMEEVFEGLQVKN